MDRHPGNNNQNPLISEVGDCTPENDVLGWIFSCKEGDLDNGDFEGLVFSLKATLKEAQTP
jgi:hypothetical protein